MRTLPHDVAEARIDEFRQGCGAEPQEWLKEAIRSGEWDRRQAENLRNMRRSVQRLAQLKREGYSFDAEHRLVAPPNPIIPRCAASRSERPRERRARRSSSGSRGDPDPESEPPLGGVTDSRPSPRTCEVCGEPFTPRRRSNATLCGSACKQKAYRRRQAQLRFALEKRIEPAKLLEWANDDPELALDAAIEGFREIRRRSKVGA